jgi:hypothetical protein
MVRWRVGIGYSSLFFLDADFFAAGFLAALLAALLVALFFAAAFFAAGFFAAGFFAAVLLVDRDELRDVPELEVARFVPEDEPEEPERERLVPLDLRGVAALAREMPSSLVAPPPEGSPTCPGE